MTDRELMQMALNAFEWNYNTDLDNIPDCNKWLTMMMQNITALRERLAQSEPEPVAWSVLNKRTGKHWYTHESRYTAQYYANEYSHRESDNTPSMVVTPLYTAPPKHEWVGLTDEEKENFENTWDVGPLQVEAIEAKLKEKNT